ncbi:unnamed protein product [Urochloa humidicola]
MTNSTFFSTVPRWWPPPRDGPLPGGRAILSGRRRKTAEELNPERSRRRPVRAAVSSRAPRPARLGGGGGGHPRRVAPADTRRPCLPLPLQLTCPYLPALDLQSPTTARAAAVVSLSPRASAGAGAGWRRHAGADRTSCGCRRSGLAPRCVMICGWTRQSGPVPDPGCDGGPPLRRVRAGGRQEQRRRAGGGSSRQSVSLSLLSLSPPVGARRDGVGPTCRRGGVRP